VYCPLAGGAIQDNHFRRGEGTGMQEMPPKCPVRQCFLMQNNRSEERMRTGKLPGTGHQYSPEIIRRMANNERKFLHIPSANISICGRLRGFVREEDIRKGIDAAARIHPLLSAKVVMKSPEEAYLARGDPSVLSLRVVPRESDSQWFDEVVNEHSVPFDAFNGPLARFVLLTSGEVSDLIIFCQHAICDGTALVLLFRDILTHAYGTVGDAGELFPPLITDFIPKEKANLVNRFVRGYSMGIINKRWQKNPWYFDHEDFLAIHRAFWDRYAYRIVLFELEGDEADALHSACREHHVTIGSAVAMAFLAAWQDILEEKRHEEEEDARADPESEAGHPLMTVPGDVPVTGQEDPGTPEKGPGSTGQIESVPGKAGEDDEEAAVPREHTIVLPYDLRNRLDNPVGDVFCLFVGSIQLRTAYDSNRSFWENTVEFHAKTRKKIDDREFFGPAVEIERFDPTLMDAFMSFTLYAKEVKKGDPRYGKLSAFAEATDNIAHILAERTLSLLPEMISTNMGRAAIPGSFGGLELEKLYIAPSASATPLVLGGIGTGRSITFTVNILAERGSEPERIKDMERVRDGAMKYLGLR
jgi:hypothetical protein